MTPPDMVLRDASVRGIGRVDVVVSSGRIGAMGAGLAVPGCRVIDVAGGALLPGLHDHHCHLLAMGAARDSVPCGPPEVATEAELASALRAAPPRAGWVRGVGYHESVAGDLDRHGLDRLRADVPVRVQHRGGSLWAVNSVGLGALGIDGRGDCLPDGVERDGAGRATGRLWRWDGSLRQRLGPRPAPDLAAVSAELASFGVTGVTDATPDLDAGSRALLRSPGLRQRLTALGEGRPDVPRKIVVSDHALPSLETLAASIAAARRGPVAVHCVTRVALVLTLAALREVGAVPGDRIEHAAVVPPDLAAEMAGLGLTVVTQPSLPRLRGDQYLNDVDSEDRDYLWPFAGLLAAGIRVGCSSDAPYGSPDPWFAIAAAAARRTSTGRRIAPAEKVTAQVALRGYLTDPRDPGGAVRQVQSGALADLVVLDAPLDDVLAEPDARHVRLVMVGGETVYGD